MTPTSTPHSDGVRPPSTITRRARAVAFIGLFAIALTAATAGVASAASSQYNSGTGAGAAIIFGIIWLIIVFGGLAAWITFIVMAARYPDSVYVQAGTSKTPWILVVVLAGWIGGLIWLFVTRPKLKRAQSIVDAGGGVAAYGQAPYQQAPYPQTPYQQPPAQPPPPPQPPQSGQQPPPPPQPPPYGQ